MNIHVETTQLGRHVQVWLFKDGYRSTENYSFEDGKMVVKQVDKEAAITDTPPPTFTVPYNVWMEMLTAFGNLAMQSKAEGTNVTFAQGEHKATLAHLADMKEIVHKFIDKSK